ncbi:MAG: TIGR00266 family protein [bacterium]|nr:TIGR00266 family protein [bacterium]
MAHQIDYTIIGDDMQAVIIYLDPAEAVTAEAGALMYKSQDVEMDTGTHGGIFKGLKRMVTGESFFVTAFKYTGAERGEVAFSAPYPGKIIPVDLSQGAVLCQKDAYLCSAYGVDINIAFTRRLGAGFFGGEGFILQRLSGNGFAFIHAGGTLIKKTLKKGDVLHVDTGCLVAFTENIEYNIQFVGGIKTALFGGEGLFFAVLSGEGEVFLQTLPFSRMADRIVAAAKPYMRKEETRAGGDIFGGLGKLISGK